jgi:hypothetical protein
VFYIKDIDNGQSFNEWLQQFKSKSETDWIVGGGKFQPKTKVISFTLEMALE